MFSLFALIMHSSNVAIHIFFMFESLVATNAREWAFMAFISMSVRVIVEVVEELSREPSSERTLENILCRCRVSLQYGYEDGV